jgi:hypothetical protein
MSTSGEKNLLKALETIRNPAPGVSLVSHGWSIGKRCRVCEQHSHAKWHEMVQGDLNPVALVQMIRSMDNGPDLRSRIIAHIVAVTGMDLPSAEQALAADAVDPHAGSTGTRPTREF